MDWPQAEYHKLFPAAVLLDISGLTTLQVGAWTRIWLWLQRAQPPGLMAPMNLLRLREWAELRDADWIRHRIAVLGRFSFHPATASLHDHGVQAHYTDYAQIIMRKREGGRASADRRNKRKIGGGESAAPTSPYARFSQPFWEITTERWPEIEEILGKTGSDPRVLQDSSNILRSMLSSTTTTTTKGGEGLPPAAVEGGAGVPFPAPPVSPMAQLSVEVIDFLSHTSDRELDDLRQRWWITATPFFRRLYAEKSPRETPGLANQLYNAAQEQSRAPTKTAPPAEAGGA